jgi:DMSO reductase family type II enzyme heme b subunit
MNASGMLGSLAMAALAAAAASAPASTHAADEEWMAGAILEVRAVTGPLPSDPGAPLWDGLPVLTVMTAPQVTIRLHDAEANAALERATLRPVRIRAATDGESLAVVLEWPDATESRATPDGVDVYGDTAAVQFPLRFGAGIRLPYVGMGDEDQPVVLHMLRAVIGGVQPRQGIRVGYGAPPRRRLPDPKAGMRYDPARGEWRAVLVRPLAMEGHDLRSGLVPFSVAVWDGAGKERGGNKSLSGWKLMRLQGRALDPTYLAELSWGRGPGETGDPGKGREIFEGTCTACHTAGAQRAAAGLAPDLTSIGVIATPAYLRDSLVDPSQVIVPNPNPAQHQDRAKGPGPGGAWPVDEGYVWYAVGPDGKRTSGMPDYAGMSRDEIAALVAYLRTLGVAPQPPGRKP